MGDNSSTNDILYYILNEYLKNKEDIIQIHTRYFQPPNEPEFKGKSRILYCKYYPNGLSYGIIITTNFRKHLEVKYIITIKKDLGLF